MDGFIFMALIAFAYVIAMPIVCLNVANKARGMALRHEGELARLRDRLAELLARTAQEAPGGASARATPPAGANAVGDAPTRPSAASTTGAEPALHRAQDRPSAPKPPAAPPAAGGAPSSWVAGVRQWLFGGNLVARVGLLVLFLGIGFLLKYAAAHTQVPIELRLASIAAADMALLAWGWRIRSSRPGISLPVQGMAIGILMLVTFSAFRAYHLIPGGLAFAILIALVALTCALAVMQDAFWLAFFGIAGGFAAPVLVSTGEGSHITLFSYCAILNAGIVAIAAKKSWRVLNLFGMFFTFAIGAGWGVLRYRPEHYLSSQLFLALFLLLYIAIAVFHARRDAPRLGHYVDGSLVFGAPLLAAGIQYRLVMDMPFGLAYSTLALGLAYTALALLVWRRMGATARLLAESFLALGVVFGTLSIPYALDGHWITAAWGLEGAGIVWMGLRQRSWLARGFGLLVQAGAWVSFVADQFLFASTGGLFAGPIPSALLLATALFITALNFQRQAGADNEPAHAAIAVRMLPLVGLAWYGPALTAIAHWLGTNHPGAAGLFDLRPQFAFHALLAGLLAAAVQPLSRACAWPALRWLSAPVWLVQALLSVAMLAILYRSGFMPGWLAWSAFGGVWAAAEYVQHCSGKAGIHLPLPAMRATHMLRIAVPWLMIWPVLNQAVTLWMHPAGAMRLALLEGADGELGGWSRYVPAWAMTGALAWLLGRARRDAWPVHPLAAWHTSHVLPAGAAWLALLAGYWNLIHNGTMAPLPYLPLLNPLDITTGFALLLCAACHRMHPAARQPSQVARAAAGCAVYLWFNLILLRSVANYMDMPYRFDTLMASQFVQAMLSLVWSASALLLMRAAARRGWRMAWCMGASLVALVVFKLFMLDLSNAGSVARIVSFIGAGLMMVAVGYLAPLPERPARGA
ncbi:DUF2339 domain-containing protein [Pseudoduganella namucuonensis]|uniref:Uncharacterized membrane protein n=1 Tax=Pseudoduganella namucuonensis TaxID=1035707 RepID=A0A1I7IXQ2_9BURK|nr:DUF2339 domain-containing protein [Pseudoduganella namucuonensis]SFU77716.1 Uncharacterized membrane protein [Pseudoduganella namucuonensis]